MLSLEQAKSIGINACKDRLGREFVNKHSDDTCTAFGQHDDEVFCFVGISIGPKRIFDGRTLRLSSDRHLAYSASCNVSLIDGSTSFLECILP